VARGLRTLLPVFLLAIGAGWNPPAQAEPVRFRIDAAESAVTFHATSRLVNADGRFHRFEGEVVVDPTDAATARIRLAVEAASIDTANQRRDNHLRSEDFFHVDRFPTATFESVRVEPRGSSATVVGRLTIRGVTRELAVPVTVEVSGERLVARGEFSINRTDYGITYSSFINPIGDIVRVGFMFRGRPGP
jgi:polyisoprenoid-binding protein YceI